VRDPRLGRDVAVKVSAQQFTDRFEREARAIAALNHSKHLHKETRSADSRGLAIVAALVAPAAFAAGTSIPGQTGPAARPPALRGMPTPRQ
jgi:hypothetical protein